MNKTIEELRAEGEKIIDGIIHYINATHSEDTKEEKNKIIKDMLSLPKRLKGVLGDTSLGFIELDEKDGILVINEEKLLLKAEQITKKRIELLKEMLLNKKMNFMLLDAILELNGYESAISDIRIKYIKKNLCVLYAIAGDCESEIQISFVITEDSEPDGLEEDFHLRVTNVIGI